jgi:hypothetical protein
MRPQLGVPAPSTATPQLATRQYFCPGREQENPEGEEEQAEPQGHERDQHRPQLPLEALGQGQDEQELWRDRRTGGRTDGGVTGRERTHGRTDREERRMEGGGGAAEPWTPCARSGPPLAAEGGRESHLFQALHVLEVEADVEEAQV